MASQGNSPLALKGQGVAMPGWNDHPSFCIETD